MSAAPAGAMPRWEDFPDEVRADVRRAAMTQLAGNRDNAIDRLNQATTDLDRQRIANRVDRIQRALDAAARLP